MTRAVVITGLQERPLDVRRIVDAIRRPDCGGLVVFEGTTRSPSEGRDVLRLEYEAYERRANAQLRRMAEEIAEQHGLGGAAAVHRLGVVRVGEPSVVVAASAPHRDAAFAGARALIDRLKAEAAIWKKEVFADGESWVGVP